MGLFDPTIPFSEDIFSPNVPTSRVEEFIRRLTGIDSRDHVILKQFCANWTPFSPQGHVQIAPLLIPPQYFTMTSPEVRKPCVPTALWVILGKAKVGAILGNLYAVFDCLRRRYCLILVSDTFASNLLFHPITISVKGILTFVQSNMGTILSFRGSESYMAFADPSTLLSRRTSALPGPSNTPSEHVIRMTLPMTLGHPSPGGMTTAQQHPLPPSSVSIPRPKDTSSQAMAQVIPPSTASPVIPFTALPAVPSTNPSEFTSAPSMTSSPVPRSLVVPPLAPDQLVPGPRPTQEVPRGLSTESSKLPPSNTSPPTNSALTCHWLNCGLAFKTWNEMLSHISTHLPSPNQIEKVIAPSIFHDRTPLPVPDLDKLQSRYLSLYQQWNLQLATENTRLKQALDLLKGQQERFAASKPTVYVDSDSDQDYESDAASTTSSSSVDANEGGLVDSDVEGEEAPNSFEPSRDHLARLTRSKDGAGVQYPVNRNFVTDDH